MAIFSAASRGAVIKLRCPKCGEDQARARSAEGSFYVCRACSKRFTKEEGTPKEPPARAKRKKNSSK